jgi:hypothetical protein
MFADTEYFGLDATASIRSYWRNRNAAGWIFLDIRREVRPDIRASNEFLPFKDQSFSKVFYDPPHMVAGRGLWLNSLMKFRYGDLAKKSDLVRNICEVNREFARILKPEGELLVKWSQNKTTAVRWAQLCEMLTNFELKKLESRPSRSGNPNGSYVIFGEFELASHIMGIQSLELLGR